VGRGLRAAIAMGQLRSAVRAVAGPGVGPAGVLSQLDRFVQQVDAAVSATVVYAEVDLRTGHVRYACAGHLPPLLVPRDGGARLVERRDRSLRVGLEGLTETGDDVRGMAPEATVEELTSRLLRGAATDDDVCVLLLSWSGARAL